MKSQKYYSGQILVIVLIVIIVGVIIGLAVLSRTIGEQQRTGIERNSSKALEVADTVLDLTKAVSNSSVASISQCETAFNQTGVCEVKGVSNVQAALEDLGINYQLASETSCAADDFNVNLKFEKVDGAVAFELGKDEVWSYALDNAGSGNNINEGNGLITNEGSETNSLETSDSGNNGKDAESPGLGGTGDGSGGKNAPNACTHVNLNFQNPPVTSAALVSTVYANQNSGGSAVDYKEYSPTDITGYCFNNSNCAADNPEVKWQGNWQNLNSGNTVSLSLAPVNGFSLDEVRVRAVGANIQFTTSFTPNNCTNIGSKSLKITSGVTCAGTYRAKEIQVPLESYAPALFDYVIFNASGTLDIGN